MYAKQNSGMAISAGCQVPQSSCANKYLDCKTSSKKNLEQWDLTGWRKQQDSVSTLISISCTRTMWIFSSAECVNICLYVGHCLHTEVVHTYLYVMTLSSQVVNMCLYVKTIVHMQAQFRTFRTLVYIQEQSSHHKRLIRTLVYTYESVFTLMLWTLVYTQGQSSHWDCKHVHEGTYLHNKDVQRYCFVNQYRPIHSPISFNKVQQTPMWQFYTHGKK